MDLVYSLFPKKQKWDFGLILFFDNNDPVGSVRFFETELLHNFSVNKNLTLVTDYEDFRRIVSNPANTRYVGVYYNIEGIKVKNYGVFHPKFYLFVSRDEMLLLAGSFNLTKSGFKRNLESVIRFKYSLGSLGTGDREFILEVKDFLQDTFVSQNALIEPVSNSLKSIVGDLTNSSFFKSVEGFFSEAVTDVKRQYFFLTSLKNSLMNQLKDRIGNRFDKVQILSPFYDATLEPFREIKYAADTVEVYVPGEKSTFPKEAFSKEANFSKEFTFFKVKKEESKVNRFVHAKYYSFLRGNQRWDLITSSNFSSAGFFRGSEGDKTGPRNLEIGVLIQNDDHSETLPLSQLDIAKLHDFNDIICDSDTNSGGPDSTSFDYEGGDRLLIESAYYDNEKIHFRLFEYNKEKDFSLGQYKARLILDQVNAGEYFLHKSRGELYFVPDLEIEGEKRIQFLLFSTASDFTSIPANVNRLRHQPNYLPALGASAFHECMRIGGEDGLTKAFEIARNSGKEDWLLYLLTHWPLERILEGLKKGSPREEETTETDNIIPTLREKKTPDYRNIILRKNVSTLLDSPSTHENLKRFLEEFDKLTDSSPQKIAKYNKFCFPLFLEITFRFYRILYNEERKKERVPSIQYPEYTWLNNYHQYLRYFRLIFKKLLPLSAAIYSDKTENSENFFFLVHFMVFLKLHTSQTIRELIKDERLFAKHYDKLTATIYDGCKSYYFISRSDVEKTVDGLSERYGISFDF